MDFEHFRRALKLSDAEAEKVYQGFAASEAAFPAELEVLAPSYLDTVLPHIGL